MSNELSPTDELQALVEQLGARDTARAAQTALAGTGEAGIAAAIWGLSHPNVRVRRGCAGFMDHHGTDACFEPLRHVALYDPAPSVRRMAVHSASCQECKQCPLTGDLVGLLVQVALSDTNRRVRLNAIWGLRPPPRDVRAVEALESILREADPNLRLDTYYTLMDQDPNYKGDPIGLHVQVALSDANRSVRLKALWGLRRQPSDARAIAALEQILRTESDPRLRGYAHHALKHQDPSYKAAYDAKARERGIAEARTRKENSTVLRKL